MSGRVRVAIEGLSEGARVLDARASHHLAVVLRLRAGDSFVAFDPRLRTEAEGRIVRVRQGTVHAEIGPRASCPDARVAPGHVDPGPRQGREDATPSFATRPSSAPPASSPPKPRARSSASKAHARRRALRAGRVSPRRRLASAGAPNPPVIESTPTVGGGPRGGFRRCGSLLPLRAGHRSARARTISCGLRRRRAGLCRRAGGRAGRERGPRGEGRGFDVVSLGDLILRTETVVTAVLGAARILKVG